MNPTSHGMNNFFFFRDSNYTLCLTKLGQQISKVWFLTNPVIC